MLTIFLTHRAQ